MATELESVKPKFLDELRSIFGGQQPNYCYQCAKCTSGCPVAKFSEDFRPHQIVNKTLLKLEQQLIPQEVVWICAACHKCIERCPQKVSPYEVIEALRNMASAKGFVPAGYLTMAKSITKTGLIQPIRRCRLPRAAEGKITFYDRNTLNLPPLPMPEKLEIFASNLQQIGFGEKPKKGA